MQRLRHHADARCRMGAEPVKPRKTFLQRCFNGDLADWAAAIVILVAVVVGLSAGSAMCCSP